MINIVRRGTKKVVVCDKCGAVLRYDENDIIEESFMNAFNMQRYNKFIYCPQCDYKIFV